MNLMRPPLPEKISRRLMLRFPYFGKAKPGPPTRLYRLWDTFNQHVTLVPRWRKEAVGAYLDAISQWQQIDPVAATDNELMAGMRALAAADAEYWYAGTVTVMWLVRRTESDLHGFLQKNAPDGNFTSGQFLSGLPSKTREAQEALWAIAQHIQADRTLCELVIATPAERLLETLQTHVEARAVVESLQDYLDTYGRQIHTLDFVEPTVQENPLSVLLNLKTMVQDVGYDPMATQSALAGKRDKALREVKQHLGKKQWWEFRWCLWIAKRCYPVREEALSYLGAGWRVLRQLALELGKRLVEVGTLSAPDDIFYLTTSELVDASKARTRGQAVPDVQQKVRSRRELREARKRLLPPEQIPVPDEEARKQNRQVRGHQILNDGTSETLKGFACSPGKVTAEASVILSLDDFGKMKPGTILVCPMTTAAWT
ncbi:hypothetical protein HYR99_04570 [Candidatus Poribacteria bacterium]|nr:hypothetical protein [Candidatus Poribacteria bacterium]